MDNKESSPKPSKEELKEAEQHLNRYGVYPEDFISSSAYLASLYAVAGLEAKLTPSEPVEQRFTIEDMKDAFFAGMDHEWTKHFGNIAQYKRTMFDEWIKTHKPPANPQ